eukprot:31520-Pelagococcus_subviridis.AAC.4
MGRRRRRRRFKRRRQLSDLLSSDDPTPRWRHARVHDRAQRAGARGEGKGCDPREASEGGDRREVQRPAHPQPTRRVHGARGHILGPAVLPPRRPAARRRHALGDDGRPPREADARGVERQHVLRVEARRSRPERRHRDGVSLRTSAPG